MRVMVMVKATKNSEADAKPTLELLEAMGKYNEELIKAGVMLAGDGLRASSMGKRVRFTGKGGAKTVLDGPFAETKEQLLGFYVIDCDDLDHALSVAKDLAAASGSAGAFEVRPLLVFHDWKAQAAETAPA